MFKSKGFTLIELVIVVVILLILGSIAFESKFATTSDPKQDLRTAESFEAYINTLHPEMDKSSLRYQCSLSYNGIGINEYQCVGTVVVPMVTGANGEIISTTRLELFAFCQEDGCYPTSRISYN